MADHHLFEFLTRKEWRVCYAVQFLDDFEEYADAYDLDRYATPGEEGAPDSYEESFRRAIRFLAIEHGYEFEAVKPQEDGSIYAESPVETRNAMYAILLASGGSPDIPGCLRDLLAAAPPSLNTEPIREAIHEVESVRDEMIRKSEEQRPEIERELRQRDEALAAWGVTTGNGRGMIH